MFVWKDDLSAEENQTNGIFLTNAFHLQNGFWCASDYLYFWLASTYRLISAFLEEADLIRTLHFLIPFSIKSGGMIVILPFKGLYKWKQYFHLNNTIKRLSSSLLIMQANSIYGTIKLNAELPLIHTRKPKESGAGSMLHSGIHHLR